jgi:uncharacterized protein
MEHATTVGVLPALRRLLISPNGGLRPIWRSLLFVGVAVIVSESLTSLHRWRYDPRAPYPATLFIGFDGLQFVGILLVTLLFARFERRSLASYGLPIKASAIQRLFTGVLFGLAATTLPILALATVRMYSVGSLMLHGREIARQSLLWLLACCCISLAEEFHFRGYVQSTLSNALGYWPAAVVTSALFIGIHWSNRGETWAGFIEVFVFGLFACFALRRTGSLWFAIGCHLAWDWSLTFLYSVPDSGWMGRGRLLKASIHGPAWLTGGAAGPEAGALTLIYYMVAILVLNRLYSTSNLRHSADPGQLGHRPDSPAPVPTISLLSHSSTPSS